MRITKDQNSQQHQFFLKAGANKTTWSSPLNSSSNTPVNAKDRSFRVKSSNKRNAPPTAEHGNRTSFYRPYMNEIARPGSILGGRQSVSNFDKSPLGKMPGFILNEIQSSTNIGKTFEVSVENGVPGSSNLLRNITEEKARITLQPLSQGLGTQLIRNRSPNDSQDNVKYFLNKRSITKNMDSVVESMTKISETLNTTTIPMNRATPSKIVIRPRETKITKILREIKSNMDSEERSRSPSQEKELIRAGSMKNSFIAKIKSPLVKSPRNKEVKIETIENKHSSSTGLPKKFISYRHVLDSQALAFKKVRAPLLQQSQDHIETSLDAKTTFVAPPFFRNMKANLSARNRELRQKFAKTINLIIRKLSLMNLTLDDMFKKKPFPMEPYEHNFSKAFIDYVKIGNVDETEKLLILDPYLVYDYDLLKQTALHWAAKRGYTKIMRILLEKGADPDARDASGRTPLFVASRASHLNSVKLLLYFGANPMIKSAAGRLAIDYATDLHIQSLLARGYKLHAFLGTYSSKKFVQTWKLIDKHEFEVKNDELV